MNISRYIDPILSNPLYTAILLLLGILLLWTILKKLVKAVVLMLIITVACAAFFWYSGKQVPASGHDLIRSVSEEISFLRDRGMSLLRDGQEGEERKETTPSPRRNIR